MSQTTAQPDDSQPDDAQPGDLPGRLSDEPVGTDEDVDEVIGGEDDPLAEARSFPQQGGNEQDPGSYLNF